MPFERKGVTTRSASKRLLEQPTRCDRGTSISPQPQAVFNTVPPPSPPKPRVTCPICLENSLQNEPVATLCGHLYCKRCIEKACEEVRMACPLCHKYVSISSLVSICHE